MLSKVDLDLPSSNRCCPTGNRESLVTMLLVMDVWSLFRRDSIAEPLASPLPLDLLLKSGSGKA